MLFGKQAPVEGVHLGAVAGNLAPLPKCPSSNRHIYSGATAVCIKEVESTGAV